MADVQSLLLELWNLQTIALLILRMLYGSLCLVPSMLLDDRLITQLFY